MEINKKKNKQKKMVFNLLLNLMKIRFLKIR